MISDLQPIKTIRLKDESGREYHRVFRSIEEIKSTWNESYNLRWFFDYDIKNISAEIQLSYTTAWKQLDQLEL